MTSLCVMRNNDVVLDNIEVIVLVHGPQGTACAVNARQMPRHFKNTILCQLSCRKYKEEQLGLFF